MMAAVSNQPREIDRACGCGADSAEAVFVVNVDELSLTVARCGGCGVYVLDPMPTPDQLAPYYAPSYYGSTPKKFVGPVARAIGWFQAGRARMVARHAEAPARVLDVGCGNGGFIMQLHERGYAVEGTELSDSSASRVPNDADVPMHVGDLLDLDLPHGTYDVITMWHVLEHVPDPHATVQRIADLLKPGGTFLLAVPNAESWQARWFGRHWLHLDPPRHLYGFGPRSIDTLLRDAGFDTSSSHTWSLEQNPYGLAQSLLNAMGFPRDRAYDVLKGVSKAGVAARVTDLVMLALLAGPSVFWSSFESLIGKGATMTVVARR